MNTLKRIDPRRPFTITADGLKRMTLGVTGVAGALQFSVPGDAHRDQPKPRRNTSSWWPRTRTVAHSMITPARR